MIIWPGFVIISRSEYEAMKQAMARCNEVCPLLVRLKEFEPKTDTSDVDKG